jgi:hypothetical protein
MNNNSHWYKKASPKLRDKITLLAGISEDETDLFLDVYREIYVNGHRGDALWERLCNHYPALRDVTLADKEDLLGLLEREHIAAKTKGKKQKKSNEDFNLLAEVESALKDAETPKYFGTINFDPDLGIFFAVPINNDPHTNCKPIFCMPSERFAQKIEEGARSENIKEEIKQAGGINTTSAQLYKEIEGVPLYLTAKQRVQILKAYLTQLKTNEIVCKFDRGEIERLPAITLVSYFKYDNEIEPYIVSCWAIGTYLFPMFPVFPFLIFIGEKGVNKSGQLAFLSRMCWNPTSKLSLPNEAPLFRMMHQAKPTLLIDEVHRLLHHPIYGSLLQALLEVGHENGGCVPRCDENDRNTIRFFYAYSPKALASRQSLELEEKGITIVLTKSYDKKYAIARKTLDTDPELDNLQENLFNFALANWEEIYNVYSTIEPTDKLSGRYFMLWAPILAICKIAYPDKYNELLAYAEHAVVGVEKKSYEVEIRILSFLFTRLDKIKAAGNSILFKEITEALNLKWQSVFSALRNLGLIKRDQDTKEGKKYYLHVNKIEKLAEERSITVEEKEICDLCGKDALLAEYQGNNMCSECRKRLEKEEPDFLDDFDKEEIL